VNNQNNNNNNDENGNAVNWPRGLLLLGVIIIGIILLTTFANQTLQPSGSEVSMGQVATLIREGEVESVVVSDRSVEVQLEGQETEVLTSTLESSATFYETMEVLGVSSEQLAEVTTQVRRPGIFSQFGSVLITLLPLIIIGWFVIMMMRSMRGNQDQAMNFGRSRARMINVDTPLVTFEDVAGMEENKQELEEVVEFLREPEKFMKLGARVPKGVLMIGPPGTGKTLLARAVAGEAGVPFLSISGSEFVEMFVGVGASRVRDLFNKAKQVAPAIIFVDELDAVGRMRGTGLGGGHDEREQTLNQILVEMDGFEKDTNIIIIAATNRADVLDPALMRPGRFDRKVFVTRPDVKGREEILEVHTKGKPLLPDVDLEVVARITPGFAGADLENLVNEAAILAARYNRTGISMEDFQEAMEKMAMGPERRSRVITPEEKKVVAFHEAGHAVTMYYLENADPVHKITIIPRGAAGGYVMPLPESADTSLHSREYLEDQIVGALGGRAAEEIVFNRITTGASSDLQKVSDLARDMVTRYGMSPRVGLRVYGEDPNMVFLGRSIGESKDYSDDTARMIDEEIKHIIDEGYARARQILTDHFDKVKLVAETLMEVETLDRARFEELMKSESPAPMVS
jgi:cell division protease FtsH